jgi:Carboxypeptidase regulatory-like domain
MLAVLLAVAFWIAALPARAEYREIEVSEPGRIEGQVKVTGEIPKLPPQPVFKQKEYCGTQVADERLATNQKGELQNAIVYLTDVKAGRPARLDQPVKLENHKCAFVPHVLTGTLGQTLEIHNSDPFLHDAHALLGSRTLFNVAILSGRTVRQPLLDAGLIHINCNIRHTWMHAYILVADHPYHAVTDADGHFVLDGVPPGIWTLRVWHELLGSVDEQVRLQPGETVTRTITLQASAEDEAK